MLKLGIWQRIFGGFALLILLILISGIMVVVQLNKNLATTEVNQDVLQPSIEALKEFRVLAGRTLRLTLEHSYFKNEKISKESYQTLQELYSSDYPQQRANLETLAAQWEWRDEQGSVQLDSAFARFDRFIELQKTLLLRLRGRNAQERLLYAQTDEFQQQISQIQVLYDDLEKNLYFLIENNSQTFLIFQKQSLQSVTQLRNQSVLVMLVGLVVGFILAFFLAKSITERLAYISEDIKRLSRGILLTEMRKIDYQDEISEMEEALQRLVKGIRRTSTFAESIGKGSYEIDFEPLGEQDVLGNSLLQMRHNLQEAAHKEAERSWKNEGATLIADILKQNNLSLAQMAERLIQTLVTYLNANQGALFMTTEDDHFLELIACYAWGKKKFISQKLQKGEGLTGQTWKEGGFLYLKEVPEDYIRITSGLGKALPRAVLIMPMQLNGVTYGMIELASFKELEDYEIEFVQNAGENIASMLSIIRNNEINEKLLRESQELAQQMTAQEEEMRQNMEELTATQEEVMRIQRELQLRNQLFETAFFILEANHQKRITFVNTLLLTQLDYESSELLDRSVLPLFSNEIEWQEGLALMENRKLWNASTTILGKGAIEIWVNLFGMATYDMNDNLKGYIFVMVDISLNKMQEEMLVTQSKELIEQRTRTEELVRAQKLTMERLVERHREEMNRLKAQIPPQI
ncbi:GAF domain-containing protein [Hugenholtzia roseola]|uniref:GAF domain-containing protein n=1 Tax=Hugenholtzia roseola TaxID=1002 RepID=UPI0003F8678C|nr:GAF domain-containing protein [Hugenholtzia roseola]